MNATLAPHLTAELLDAAFPRYREFDPAVPIWCVTPDHDGAIHRFFDTCPISPSGRYLAFFKLPQEHSAPQPGEAGTIGLVDLFTGEQRLVAETRAWEPQMGANLNWGVDDHSLIFNDIDTQTWTPHGVRLDPFTGERNRLDGTAYHVSPDGRLACSCNLAAMRRTQSGYGAALPAEHVPQNIGPRDDDGLFITDTQTGERRLLLSLKDAIEKAQPAFEIDDPDQYEIYGFHSKWSPTGERLIFTIRFFRHDGTKRTEMIKTNDLRYTVLTVSADGSEVHNAVPTHRWIKPGHHINWSPDGERLTMNLTLEDELQLCGCDYTGQGLAPITAAALGSGHPTMLPDGRHLLTDTYVFEPMAFGDGTTPLRWIDTVDGTDRTIARIRTQTPAQDQDSVLRVDPHPAWSRDWNYFVFNAFVDGTRRVYLADATSLTSV